jgi:hypothetical protein
VDHLSSSATVTMKLMLRPEWRLRPFSSFLGCLDLKTGVILALLFAVRCNCHQLRGRKSELSFLQLFNKVAGVYGLIAVLTGAGGSAAQLSLYIYSTVALVALAWGLNAVKRVGLSYVRVCLRSLHVATPRRKIRRVPCILRTSSLPTTFYRPRGPSFLPLCGGCIAPTMVGACPARLLKTTSSRTILVRRKRSQRRNVRGWLCNYGEGRRELQSQ